MTQAAAYRHPFMRRADANFYSHSIVAGGLLDTS